MTSSILQSIKNDLSVGRDDTSFDSELINYINMTFYKLNQIGVGPEIPYSITGYDETWSDFMCDIDEHYMIKTYMYLEVRLLFDPPVSGTLLENIKEKANEYEWRLNVDMDKSWTYNKE